MLLSVSGADCLFLCGILYVSKIASREDQAQAGSTISTITQLGSSILLAIISVVASKVQVSESDRLGHPLQDFRNTPATSIPKEALLKSYRAAFWTCFALVALSIVITLLGLRQMGYVGAGRTKRASPAVEMAPSSLKEEEQGDVGDDLAKDEPISHSIERDAVPMHRLGQSNPVLEGRSVAK